MFYRYNNLEYSNIFTGATTSNIPRCHIQQLAIFQDAEQQLGIFQYVLQVQQLGMFQDVIYNNLEYSKMSYNNLEYPKMFFRTTIWNIPRCFTGTTAWNIPRCRITTWNISRCFATTWNIPRCRTTTWNIPSLNYLGYSNISYSNL